MTWDVQTGDADRRCAECGLRPAAYGVAQVADQLEFAAAEWVQILTASPAATDAALPTAGSPLAHGVRIRDAMTRFDEVLAQLDPGDREIAVLDHAPDDASQDPDMSQDPDIVAEQLMAAAGDLVERLRAITSENEMVLGADGTRVTVRALAQDLLHDVTHHLWDVTGQPAVSASD